MKIKFLIPFLLVSLCANAQNPRKEIRKGNSAYEDSIFNKAENLYRAALHIDQDDFDAAFNLADAIYKQNKFEESTPLFKQLTESAENNTQRAMAYHNLGNSLLKEQKTAESISAYKNALKNNPNDLETKHNLAFAQRQQQEQQQEEQKEKQEDSEDQKDEEEKKDDNSGEQEQKKQQQQKEAQNPDQISKEEAEKMLEALAQQEKEIQEKLQKNKKGVKLKIEKDW